MMLVLQPKESPVELTVCLPLPVPRTPQEWILTADSPRFSLSEPGSLGNASR